MALPKILTARLQKILWEEYHSVIDAFSNERKGSFRLNTLYPSPEEVFEEFKSKWIIIDPFAGLEWVYTFDRIHQYAIKGTRAFYDGKIYLQSITSMLPVYTLGLESGMRVLDICAAPGSKTTQMSMIMKNTGKIIALEQDRIRFEKMLHNIHLQGAKNIEGIKIDARKYLSSRHCEERSNPDFRNTGSPHSAIAPLAMTETLFDRILLDAPCSAEGRILVSNEKTYGFWSLTNIEKKAELQYELLSLAIDHLKAGGELIYSTCTLAPEENEWVIARMLRDRDDLEIMDIDLWLSGYTWWTHGISEFENQVYPESIKKAVRILPSHETEGFFIAKLRKL